MQQPPDPNNPISGQFSPYDQSNQLSAPQPSNPGGPTGQLMQSSPYNQYDQTPVAPAPPLLPAQGNYPGETGFYNQLQSDGGPNTQQYAPGGKDPMPATPVMSSMPSTPFIQDPKPGNIWRNIALVLFVLLVISGGSLALLISHPSILGVASPSGQVGTNSTAVVPQATATSSGQQPTQAVPPTVAASDTPTPPPASANNYSAVQPGPGCDSGGGTWTLQGISRISCGTSVTPASGGTWNYLYLQLPSNETFSSNNEIGIQSAISFSMCLGLVEQGTNTGFLVAYCDNGQWSIYLISNGGAIVKTLDSGLTSTRQSEQLSLSLSDTTVSFNIDTEIYKTSVSSIQPIKVGIGFYYNPNATLNGISVQNFSYITPAS